MRSSLRVWAPVEWSRIPIAPASAAVSAVGTTRSRTSRSPLRARSITSATRLRSSAWLNGLTSRPAAPRASASWRWSSVPEPVTSSTGRLGRRARTSSRRSNPERPGMTMSLTTSESSGVPSRSSASRAEPVPIGS